MRQQKCWLQRLKRELGVFQAKKNPLPKQRIIYGRGGETRTRDTRFWRPVLYQLSYAPKVFCH